jgi:hypothetical protein
MAMMIHLFAEFSCIRSDRDITPKRSRRPCTAWNILQRDFVVQRPIAERYSGGALGMKKLPHARGVAVG